MELETTLSEIAPGLLRYCRARTGEPDLAEEIAQEVLAVLVERYRRGEPPESPAAFAFAVARRRSARAVARRRWLAPLEALRSEEREGLWDSSRDPETRVLERERLRWARDLLAKLPAKEREALLLVVAGDLEGVAAAGVLGISLPAFKMRLHRARRRLVQLQDAEAVGAFAVGGS